MRRTIGRKKWFIVVTLVLVAGISYVTFPFLIHQGNEPLAVSDYKLRAESLQGRQITLKGRVTPGSVEWDEETQVLRFALTDDRESLVITYEGIVPDNFKPGDNLEVRGNYRSGNTFEALSLDSGRSFCNLCH